MPPRKPTAYAQLDRLSQQAAAERVRHRDLAAEFEAAKHAVEQASRAITDGYAAEDERAVGQAREAEQQAVAKVKDQQHRLTGAEVRVARTQRELDEFRRDRARDLLKEREQPARTVAAELTASVRQTLTLAKAYEAERQTVDQLVAAVPGATPRNDGPAPEHPWEHALRGLQRAYQHTPELDPPLPRWTGLQHRQQQDDVNRRASLLRKRQLTASEQAELERLDRGRVITPPVSITNVSELA
jgi:hypothetical protein